MCAKIVEEQITKFGLTYDIWRETQGNESSDYLEYLRKVLLPDAHWRWSYYLELQQKKYKYSLVCECGLQYEYDKDIEGRLTRFCCPSCQGDGRSRVCPICRQVYDSERRLTYDPDRNLLRCGFCYTEFEVKGPPLKSKGDFWERERPLTLDEKRIVELLNMKRRLEQTPEIYGRLNIVESKLRISGSSSSSARSTTGSVSWPWRYTENGQAKSWPRNNCF